jgi:hypothetical protein
VQMGFEDAGAAFGHAVELGQAAGPARHHIGLELGRNGALVQNLA